MRDVPVLAGLLSTCQHFRMHVYLLPAKISSTCVVDGQHLDALAAARSGVGERGHKQEQPQAVQALPLEPGCRPAGWFSTCMTRRGPGGPCGKPHVAPMWGTLTETRAGKGWGFRGSTPPLHHCPGHQRSNSTTAQKLPAPMRRGRWTCMVSACRIGKRGTLKPWVTPRMAPPSSRHAIR